MGCFFSKKSEPLVPTKSKYEDYQLATFGGGCFWCTEAIYRRIKGVKEVYSGYAGSDYKNPTYRDVCSGTTGHAEVIQIKFNEEASYTEILNTFFQSHDASTLNQQGNDKGT